MIWGGADGIIIEISVSHSAVSDSCDPMNCSPPGSSVHGILQARIPEWVVISFSRRSSQPRDWTQVSRIAGRLSTDWTSREDYRNRSRAHNKCTAFESSWSLPSTPVHQKIVFHNNHRSQGRNFKCSQLSQLAGLGRCWSRYVPRDRTSLALGPQQTSSSLGDNRRDLFVSFFFNILVG